MSKSRLEKFLYALYSLDSSDLPTPLSRIEELYKCLVTGDEAPTFEPLSRVEKYLMAILGVYDVDSLPNPLSRVEVLLYKLATGDDNLDDIKSFLSEHEELLAEIIRNGGVGGNIDIEYVLYTLSTEFNTLYNTAEKPVKSAILKGNTLVNLYPVQRIDKAVEENKLTDLTTQQSLKIPISNGKKAIFTFNISTPFTSTFTGFCQTLPNWHLVKFSITNGKNFIIFDTTNINDDIVSFDFYIDNAIVGNYTITDMMVIEYQDGMENWGIPYFESMQSVKMPVLTTTGKNLFDGIIEFGGINSNTGLDTTWSSNFRTSFMRVPKNNTNFLFTFNYKGLQMSGGYLLIIYYNENKERILMQSVANQQPFKFNQDAYYYRITQNIKDNLDILDITNIQLEEGTVATSYEPHKSNILTVNEEVELGGVGDVKDELNLLTGEVTKRVGEVVFDGSEYWVQSGMVGSMMFYTSLNDMAHKIDYLNSISCDKLTTYAGEGSLNQSASPNGIAGYIDTTDTYPNENWLYIKLADSEGSVEKLKQWLSQNPITVRYELATESVKTVDLSVVDQDGNNTKLSTFNDITHVTLSSEGLIPEAELEVATKNEEDLEDSEDSSVYTVHTLSEEFNTLYNTAEKPVKSAILKGDTLLNVHPTNYKVIGVAGGTTFFLSEIIPKTMIKPNTRYFLRLYNTHQSIVKAYFKPCVNNSVNLISSDNKCAIFTTKSELTEYDFVNNKIHFYSSSGLALEDVKDTKVILCEYVDGMENWDIPYFEGMLSVKMPVLTTTGKNLFDGRVGEDKKRIISTGVVINDSTFAISEYISVSPNKNYICNKSGGYGSFYDSDKKLISTFWNSAGALAPQNAHYVRISFEKTNMDDLQFEENSTSTSYEPFKTNILTVNEEVELGSVGEVKDELDLLTGKITQRTDIRPYQESDESDSEVLTDMTNTRYKLAQEVVKTVDLSVVDQDGNNTKLSTFNDITHVTLSSEGVIPEAELEVAEKVPEVAASMLTISREQEVINATTNEQSENVDATMIATTEIYEELL